ncbi:MFS transporter [Aquabacterium sp. A7-Y]|uniref:MFS transporter n=1 Tax=Aquabacterium sp. A7-Y TaxID=1349605 RepID=UPI00223E88CF|nr:MFS transporter [Aquabacterium sp. A7-Y]MCW7537575.1 MFS transporter [Aquabacterium sp. A7-Y]
MTESASGSLARSTPSLRAARWATRAQFFCAGFLFATWGVHVPTVRAHYEIGEGALGIAMLTAGIGALLGLSQAGRLVGRYGPKALAAVCGLSSALAIALLLSFPSYPALLGVMALFGVMSSVFDVAINAEASELERREGRALMSGFHALFSLGGMAGAGLGSLLMGQQVAAQTHLVGAALLSAAAMGLACLQMLPPEGGPAKASRFSLPRGSLLLLGVLAALGLIAEGAMYDWSVLYLQKELGSPQDISALAYASFSGAMAAARFAGDRVRERFAAAPLMFCSAALAALSMAVVLVSGHEIVALIGFALVGVGLGNVVPVLFSAAARVPGTTPAHGIAAVSSVGYLGFMAGPPLIGMLAQGTSLTAALFVVVVFSAVLAAGSRRALAGGV